MARAGRELPFAFAAGAELAAVTKMHRRLGDLDEPYELEDAGRYATVARWLTGAGAVLSALGRRQTGLRRLGAMLILSGALSERWAVFRAEFISERDPKYTVGPQRARADGLRRR